MHYAARRFVIFAVAATLLPAILVYHRQKLLASFDAVNAAIEAKTSKLTQAGNGSTSSHAHDYSAVNPPPPPVDDYIASCLAVKNQTLDLPEWLHHHYFHMGIGRFFVMDDGSQPPLEEQLAHMDLRVPREVVEFHYYTEDQRVKYMQYKVYNDCVQLVRNRTQEAAAAVAAQGANGTESTAEAANYKPPTWMAFIDADEFIDARGEWTLRETLEAYEKIEAIGALGINWREHTSDGNLVRPPSVLGSYTTCIWDDPEGNGAGGDNRHVKSIVKINKYERPHDPHSFFLRNNTITVGENGDMIGNENMKKDFPGSAYRRPITRQKLAIHHYATKSRAEFEEKMSRGSGMSHKKNDAWWDKMENKLPHVDCPEMQRWADPATIQHKNAPAKR